MADGTLAVTAGSGTYLDMVQRSIGSNTVLQDRTVMGEPAVATYTASTVTAISAATAAAHLFQVMAGASLRVPIRRIQLWQVANAGAATVAQMAIYRLSSAGTGGGVLTPSSLDPADGASGATVMTLPTAKGTEGALLWSGTVTFTNAAQGAGFGPVLDLSFVDDTVKDMVIAAGTSNGIALKHITGVASVTVIPVVWFGEINYQ